MSESSVNLERDVEARRANVENTLDALKDRLSSDRLIDEVGRFVGLSDARGALQTAGQQVRENPLALGLIGLGVAWLVMGSGRKAETAYERPDWQDQNGARNLRGRADTIGDRVSAMADTTGATLRDAVGGLRDTALDMRDRVADAAAGAQDRVRSSFSGGAERASDLGQGIARRLEDQPLLAGAVALGIGAVIGAALPRTGIEDRVLGDSRNEVLDRARAASVQVRDKVTEVASDAYHAAVSTARDEGLVPDGQTTIAAKVGKVARAAVNEARSHVSDTPGDTQA